MTKINKRLTKRQKRIARAALKHPTDTQREIGDKLGIRQPHISEELNKPHVKAHIADLMDKHPNLTDAGIAEKLSKMQDAKAKHFFQKDGMVTDEREVDDNGIQMAALHLAAELKGHKQKKVDVTSNGNTLKSLLSDD